MNESGIEISESKLEDFIYEHLKGLNDTKGFKELPWQYGSVCRQVNLGSAGIADIVAVHHRNNMMNIEIYELKKGCIDTTALLQVLRYRKAASALAFNLFKRIKSNITCHLIGNKVASGDFRIAASAIPGLKLWVYDFCPNTGVLVSEESWSYTNPKIPTKTINSFLCEDYYNHDEECLFYLYMKDNK